MRRTLMFAAAALLAVPFLGRAARAQAADEAGILAANSAFYAALSARDVAAVERVWGRDQVFNIFGASRLPLVGWADVRAGYVELFARFPELTVALPAPAVRQDGDVALVIGVETLRGRLANGDAANLMLPTTNVFVRQGGKWLMVHHHSSRPPQ